MCFSHFWKVHWQARDTNYSHKTLIWWILHNQGPLILLIIRLSWLSHWASLLFHLFFNLLGLTASCSAESRGSSLNYLKNMSLKWCSYNNAALRNKNDHSRTILHEFWCNQFSYVMQYYSWTLKCKCRSSGALIGFCVINLSVKIWKKKTLMVQILITLWRQHYYIWTGWVGCRIGLLFCAPPENELPHCIILSEESFSIAFYVPCWLRAPADFIFPSVARPPH